MMASLKHLTDEELRKKLKEYGITSPVTASTRTILLKKLNHVMSTDKTKNTNSVPKSLSRTNKDKIQIERPSRSRPRDQSNSFTFDQDDNTSDVDSPRLRASLNPAFNSKYLNGDKSGSAKGSSRRSSKLGLDLNSFSSDEDEGGQIEGSGSPGVQIRKSIRNYTYGTSSRPHTNASLFWDEYQGEDLTLIPSPVSQKCVPIIRKKSNHAPLSYTKIRPSTRSTTYQKSKVSDDYQYDTGSDSDVNLYDGDGGQPSGRLYSDKSSLKSNSDYSNDYMKKKLTDNLSNDYRMRSSSNFWAKNGNDQNSYEVKNIPNPKTPFAEKEEIEITSPDDIVSQDPLAPSVQLANGQSPFDRVRKLTSDHCTFDGNFWLPSVPILLVGLLALFFCVLGLCYVNIHTPILPSSLFSSFSFLSYKNKLEATDYDDKTTNLKDLSKEDEVSLSDINIGSKFPVCEEKTKIDCLSLTEQNSVPEILGLLEKSILPALSRQAALYQCGDAHHHHLTIDEITDILNKELQSPKTSSEISDGLQGLGKLASLNPHWGIKPVWDTITSGETIPKLAGLGTSTSPIEIICHITSVLYSFLCVILVLLIGSFGAWMAFQLFRYHKRLSEEAEQRSFELVEKILEVLENSCGTGGKEYIAVNHVRDCLIPPRERQSKTNVWEKAVKFIDDHDSRVYREIRSVGGEDCEVWRWVSGAPRSPISCPPKASLFPDASLPPEKIWQGQAFESLETTQNVPQVSPTSCLKVRNMFDCEIEFGENWPRRIQDSLLEKCEGINIVHVAVDRVSKEGCVYLKCSSAHEAGKAFRALHGWWFDGSLVTVKYLRDERYHERFPTARNATAPLTPSNNKRLSLQFSPSTSSSTASQSSKISSSRRIERSTNNSSQFSQS